MVSAERAVSALKYGAVLAFVAGATFSPPDPFTQVFFAVPLLVVSVPLVYLILGRETTQDQHVSFAVGAVLLIYGGLQVVDLLSSVSLDFRVRLAWVTIMLPIIAWVVYFRESERGLEESSA